MGDDPKTTCPDCAGTGGGHPDNLGCRCERCGGTGGVAQTTKPQPYFRCACPTPDAKACIVVRYANICIEPGERCECPCHDEDDEDE